ncbi:MAG TPA: carbohydrate kinase family protein [Candidatus Sulfotelmatobacter sp.]|nr:carbohydrate kinase family protein [Candidatus Sulfotelmatobacter sp.]
MIGNLLVDLIVRGVEDLPAWGREVSGTNHRSSSAGQAGNLARGLVALGMAAGVVGNVGRDEAGSQILRDLSGAGVSIESVEVSPTGATALSIAIVRPDGERAFLSDFASLAEIDEALVMRHWDAVCRASYVCLVGLFNLPALDLRAAKRILAAARAEGRTTVLDTGWDPKGWQPGTVEGIRALLEDVDIFLPNAEEACALTGQADPVAAAQGLEEWGCRLVVVKMGAEGSLARRAGQVWQSPAFPAAVHDAVGAGDVFDAGFLIGVVGGREAPAAMAFANAAASIYVSRSKDRFPSPTEVLGVLGVK